MIYPQVAQITQMKDQKYPGNLRDLWMFFDKD